MPPGDYPGDRYAVMLAMPEICNATTYSPALSDSSGLINASFHFIGAFPLETFGFPSTIIGIAYPSRDIQDNFEYVITASNDCSSKSTEAEFGCFLKDAPVTMANGSTKLIQDVVVGDIVLGAFGEHNPVLALHRPLLGAGHIVNINNEHKTTSHHPHVSSDRRFYCVDTEIINKLTYNKTHTIILGDGTTEKRIMKGLSQGRIHRLTEGIVLQTTTGPKPVESIEAIKMSPLTQVYHLVVGGSHTFNVEGYAVVGWADETDFDYDAWVPKV